MSGAKAVNANAAVNLSILGLLGLLTAWGYAIATFGYPAIIMPALSLTVVGLISLVFVTRG